MREEGRAISAVPRADQMQLPAAVAAAIRARATRAGVGFLLVGALLTGVTLALILIGPDGGGFLTPVALGGGANTGLMTFLAGAILLDARGVVTGQTVSLRRTRRIRRVLLLILGASVVISAVTAYGVVRIADDGEPIAGLLLLPLAGCVLTALAVVVGRSVLRPATDHR